MNHSSSMSESRILLLVRHAKSSWKHPELDDIDRPLNRRGQRDAPEMGRRLRERLLIPDLMVSSPAVRARTTAELMAETIGYSAEILIVDDLYAAAPRDVLDVVSALPDGCATAMVVGHNPTMTDLANRFTDQEIDNVPTCGILTVEASSWPDIRQGRLLDFDYPKRS